jgi:tetratricopeptide (TPR) repeat protein
VGHFRRGQELLAAGRHREAIAELETVTRLAPDSIGGHHELAKAHNAAGRHADALREMQQTLRLTMTDRTATRPTRYAEESDLRYELATLLAKNGEFMEAVTELGKASRLDVALERSPDYQILLGIAQAGRGRDEAAREALARAGETSPDMTRHALTDWIEDRPDSPEAPLLGRILTELSPAAPTAPESPPLAEPEP